MWLVVAVSVFVFFFFNVGFSAHTTEFGGSRES